MSSIASLPVCLFMQISIRLPRNTEAPCFPVVKLKGTFWETEVLLCISCFLFSLSFNKAVSSLCACPGNCNPSQCGFSQSPGNWQLQEMFPGAEFSDCEVTLVLCGTTLLLHMAVCQEHITRELSLFPRNLHLGSPPQPDFLSFPSESFPHKP